MLKMPFLSFGKPKIKILSRLGIIFSIAFLFFFFKPLFTPPQSIAQTPVDTNVDTFTGQVIPAFIGSEYDPTEAFIKLTGATVYVFAYDTWGSTSMVVGGIAIKTQIRADGSFQAVGLPHASKYGVYFPYDDKGPTEWKTENNCLYNQAQCDYIDYCIPGIGWCSPSASAVDCDENGTVDCCAGAYCESDYIQSTPFRWPKPAVGTPGQPNYDPGDGIQDIFGYQQKDYPADVAAVIHDQLGNIVNLVHGPDPSTRTRRRIFVTSSNRLDMENHVNVFPVVPTSVLKFRVNNRTTAGSTPYNPDLMKTPIKIMAQRILIDNSFIVNGSVAYPYNDVNMWYIRTNEPQIEGKTTVDGDFEVYAPPGRYAVSYYLNDDFFGFQVISVNPYENYVEYKRWSLWSNPIGSYSTCPPGCDYSGANSCPGSATDPNSDCYHNYLRLYFKPIYLWGIVTKPESTTVFGNNEIVVVPDLIPFRQEVSLYVNSNRPFEGLTWQKWNYAHHAHDAGAGCPQKGEEIPPSTTGSMPIDNVTDLNFEGVGCPELRDDGIFIFRTQGATDSVTYDVGLIDYDAYHTDDPADSIKIPPKICGSGTEFCKDQLYHDAQPSGIYNYPFSLEAASSEGLKIKAKDAVGNGVSDAIITFNTEEASLNVKAIETNKPFVTDSAGEKVIPFSVLLNSLALNVSNITSIEEADIPSAIIISFNNNNGSTGQYTLTKAELMNAYNGSAGCTQSNPISSPIPIGFDYDCTYAITIPTSAVRGALASSGIIWLAQATHLSVPKVFAQTTERSNDSTFCGNILASQGYDLDGDGTPGDVQINGEDINRKDPYDWRRSYLRITGSFSEPLTKKTAIARFEFTWKNSNTSSDAGGAKVMGHKFDPSLCTRNGSAAAGAPYNVPGCNVWTMPNYKNGDYGFYYDKDGRYTLFLPCLTQTAKIAISGCDETSVWHGVDLEDIFVGSKEAYANIHCTGEKAVSSVPFNIEMKAQSGKVAGSGLNLGVARYTYNREAASNLTLTEDCPGLDMAHLGNLVPNIVCMIGKGVAELIPKVFNWLEGVVLTTVPLTDTPAVVFLWNTMRQITNFAFVIVMFVIGVSIVLHVNSKDFNIFHFLLQMLKAVFLANFSLTICQFFIDVNNILVHATFQTVNDAIINNLGNTAQYKGFAAAGISAYGTILSATLGSAMTSAAGLALGAGLAAAPAVGLFIVATIASMGFTLIVFVIGVVIQFVIRYAIIWLCVILAPFNFLLAPTPFGKTINKLWFSTFIGMNFVQTGIAILLSLGMALLVTFPALSTNAAQGMLGVLVGGGIMYLAIKSPSTIAGFFGAGQLGGVMSGVGKGLQGAAQGLGQKFSAEQVMGRTQQAKGEYQMWEAQNPEKAKEKGLRGALRRGYHRFATGANIVAPLPILSKQAEIAKAKQQGKEAGLGIGAIKMGDLQAAGAAKASATVEKVGEETMPGWAKKSSGTWGINFDAARSAPNYPEVEYKGTDAVDLDEGEKASYRDLTSNLAGAADDPNTVLRTNFAAGATGDKDYQESLSRSQRKQFLKRAVVDNGDGKGGLRYNVTSAGDIYRIGGELAGTHLKGKENEPFNKQLQNNIRFRSKNADGAVIGSLAKGGVPDSILGVALGARLIGANKATAETNRALAKRVRFYDIGKVRQGKTKQDAALKKAYLTTTKATTPLPAGATDAEKKKADRDAGVAMLQGLDSTTMPGLLSARDKELIEQYNDPNWENDPTWQAAHPGEARARTIQAGNDDQLVHFLSSEGIQGGTSEEEEIMNI